MKITLFERNKAATENIDKTGYHFVTAEFRILKGVKR